MTNEKKNQSIISDKQDELSEQELSRATGGYPPNPCGGGKYEPPDPCLTKKR